MLRSDAPWAMARTLTLALASAANTCAATPCAPAMPSPTTARMLQLRLTSTLWIWPSRSSGSNARRTTRSARSASGSGTAKQIECSELPCEIRMTEMPSSRSAPNNRCAVPGTPIMPAPSRFTSAMRSTVVMPLTSGLGAVRSWISVPGASGAKVFLIQIGMRFWTAGAMVCGWMTLAPK
ncbi:MAG: hypothetical protein QG550_256 [Pseudomonadota bacterium]|nr:hypothetical protein [Pseudomonadota bacterium]